jgi:hypothetical protein
VEEQLLASGEDKILPAIYAPQHFILKFHDPVRCQAYLRPATSHPPRKDQPIYVGPAAATAMKQTKAFGGETSGEGAAILAGSTRVLGDTQGPDQHC